MPEGTLRSQVSRGLDLLRGNLARAGTSLQVSAIVAALPALLGEAAPAALAGSIGQIVRGLGEFSPAALAAKGSLAGGGISLAKVAGIVAVVAACAAAVGTGVYVASPGARPATVVPAGTILFQDSFENGLGNWLPVKGVWSIAKGKGAGGGDCLQVEQSDFIYPLIWSNCDPGCSNFEVRFKIFLPTDQNVWLGLFFGSKEWPPKGGSHTFWESIGGAENAGWRRGKWRDYRCTIRGDDFERVSSIGTNIVKQEQFRIGYVEGRRPGLQIAWFGYGKGPFVYVDDFVVKKIE
jgi:hypothetical protein